MVRHSLLAIGLLAFGAMLPASANATVTYQFTSFDGPGSNSGGTTVDGINNNGQVVGFSSDNAASPTLQTNFVRNPNGIFTIMNLNNDPLAMATGINNSQAVVGATSNSTSFYYSGGTFITLPAVNGTTTSETAFGINDNGAIVGQFTDANTDTSPGFFRSSSGAYTVLLPLITATFVNAQGVNNNGLVAGFYSADGVHQHGFFYDASSNRYTLAPDPVIPNLVLTEFLGINDSGIVAGYYQLPDGSQHGLLYNVNTQSYTFLDDPNAAISGYSVTQITGINNSGQITGFYVDSTTGLQRGFIATPLPEPSIAFLTALVLAPILCRYRS